MGLNKFADVYDSGEKIEAKRNDHKTCGPKVPATDVA